MYLKETGWKWKRSSWYLSYRISVLRSVRITVKENLLNRLLNPLSPNSDQQQFSPNNIQWLSRDKVMRINKMIIIEEITWSFIKFSQLILKGDVWRSVWRICMWMLGLKGLTRKWVIIRYPKNVKTHHAIKSLFEINKEFSLFFYKVFRIPRLLTLKITRY